MATAEQRLGLRRRIGDVDEPQTYEDSELDVFIEEASDDLDIAAARVWRSRASSYAEMVDISEAGSSRKNSDLFKNAVSQAQWYEAQSESDSPSVPEGTYSTTRRIVRL